MVTVLPSRGNGHRGPPDFDELEETGQWRRRTSDRVRSIEATLQWQRGAMWLAGGLVTVVIAIGAWMVTGQVDAQARDSAMGARLEAIVSRLERIERKIDNE